MGSRNKRSKRRTNAGPGPAPGPPAPPAPGAARFLPSSNYIAHHPPPMPQSSSAMHPAYPSNFGYGQWSEPPPTQRVLEEVLAGLQPLAAPPPNPLAYASAPPPLPPGRFPNPAAFVPAAPLYGSAGRGPGQAAWPPQPAAFSRTSAPSPALDPLPPRAPPAPALSARVPASYTRASGSATHIRDFPLAYPVAVHPVATAYTRASPRASPASPLLLPPPPPLSPRALASGAAHVAARTSSPTVSSASPPRSSSPSSGARPRSPVAPPPASTPAAPAPALSRWTAAHATPPSFSTDPAALRAAAPATPNSTAPDFVTLLPPSGGFADADAGPGDSSSSSSSASSHDSGSWSDTSSDGTGDASSGDDHDADAGDVEDEVEDEVEDGRSSDSEDEARVATALVGPRKPNRPQARSRPHASESSSEAGSEADEESGLRPDGEAEAVDSDTSLDLEEAVQDQVGDDDDGDDLTLPDASLAFDLGSASEVDTAGEDDIDPDQSLERAAHTLRRKRQRLDSVATTHDEEEDSDAVSSRAVSTRAVSLDPVVHMKASDDEASPRKRARRSQSPLRSPSHVSPAPPRPAPTLAEHAFSTSTPSRLPNVLIAPARAMPAPATDLVLAAPTTVASLEDEELEEGELPSQMDEAARPLSTVAASYFATAAAPSDAHDSSATGVIPSWDAAPSVRGDLNSALPAFPLDGAPASLRGAIAAIYATSTGGSGTGHTGTGDTVGINMSFTDLPADLLADVSRRSPGAHTYPALSHAATKAAYEHRIASATDRPDDPSSAIASESSNASVVARSNLTKLSYNPLPSAKPPVSLLDPSAAAPAPSKGVYNRRQPVSNVSKDVSAAAAAGPSAAPLTTTPAVKAVYERPAGAPDKATGKQRSKAGKAAKPQGQLPLSHSEKMARLPSKLYNAFGDFPTPEAAADPAIWSVPHHTVLPGLNLPPPNESRTHGFWPGPPALKFGKAIFPAPPEPLDVAEDPRPRVDVFIDNSNVLYSFLNWVRARPDVKILSKPVGSGVVGTKGGKDGSMADKGKTVKVVTIGGRKVCLDYRVLFALIERGRRIERRVLVSSSTLWQTLEPAVEWGYEISLLQRVPRTSPSTSASTVAQVAQAASAMTTASKKRGKNGKVKKGQQPVPQLAVVEPQNSGVKHFKEQARTAVDELVHMKILESLLDFTPDPLPPPSPPRAAAIPQLALSPSQDLTPQAAGPPASVSADRWDPVLSGSSANAHAVGATSPAVGAPHLPASSSATSLVVSNPAAVGISNTVQHDPMNVVSDAPIDLAVPASNGDERQPGGEDKQDATAMDQNAAFREEDDGTSTGDARGDGQEGAGDDSAGKRAGFGTAASEAATHSLTAIGLGQDRPAAGDSPAVASLPGTASVAVTPASAPASARFLPSQAFLSGAVRPAKPMTMSVATTAADGASAPPRPSSGASKFTPAVREAKIEASASGVGPAKVPAQTVPVEPAFAPRIPPRDRPTLVIVTGDANSSEYNPGGFLGCVRRALDRGWDVEVVAFTKGISSLWTGEQQIKVTTDGRRRGELRLVDLTQFGEELVM